MTDRLPTPYYQDEFATLYLADCRDVLPLLPAGSVDLVLTDPPYVFGIASTMQDGKCTGWGDLMNSAVWYESWLRECRRLMMHENGAAWVFNSWRSFPVLARAAYASQWPITSLLVWDKEWIGPGGHQGLRPSYELVALFAQPSYAVADRGIPDIMRCMWSATKPNGHPAEKPVSLLRRLIDMAPSTCVLDPFCGVGSTLVAARSAGRRSIGIEIEERYCAIAARRLAQNVLPLDEPPPVVTATQEALQL
jgi:site-specific DNA-methyltransferase (adenine-specific)